MKQPVKLNIKPLSVNECWRGRRFKTPAYERYVRDVGYLLPAITLPPAPYKLTLVFGVSNPLADWDNPVKPFQDILQKKYGFNDKLIISAQVCKERVEKGREFILFHLESHRHEALS